MLTITSRDTYNFSPFILPERRKFEYDRNDTIDCFDGLAACYDFWYL